MLWQKQLQNGKFLYVDIFSEYGTVLMFDKFDAELNLNATGPTFKKDNDAAIAAYEIADYIRINEENSIAQEKKEIQINKMLCLAEIGDELVGFAYAIRSMFFKSLRKYSMCLADIESAEKKKYLQSSGLHWKGSKTNVYNYWMTTVTQTLC